MTGQHTQLSSPSDTMTISIIHLKDGDDTQKNTEDQNRCIDLFIHGNKDKIQTGDKPSRTAKDNHLDVNYLSNII